MFHQFISMFLQETKSLIQYDIMWYSSISCIPGFYKRTNLSFPLVMISCVNPLKMPIVFYLNNNSKWFYSPSKSYLFLPLFSQSTLSTNSLIHKLDRDQQIQYQCIFIAIWMYMLFRFKMLVYNFNNVSIID